MKFYPTRAFALALVLATPVTAFATNGMFMIGYGIKSVGMGGVAIAAPLDSLAGATNPAGIAEVGTRFDLEATLFKFNAEVSLGGVNSKSRFNTFLMPGLGFSMPVDNETTFGFSMVGAGGGGSHYKQNLYENALSSSAVFGDLGVELMIMQMNPTMAQKITPTQMVGGSLVMEVQRFKAFGLNSFENFTVHGTNVTNNLTNRGVEYSRGMGVRLGWLGKFLENKLNLGLAATSKIYMTRFQNYAELFAENGDIDTPANLGAGISWKTTPKLMVAMDVTRTYYSKVRAIANPGPRETPTGNQYPISRDVNALGLDGGMGFGWKDQTVYKVGFNYEQNKKWTWRAGYNYGKSPIDSSKTIIFHIVVPATTQHHLTLGTTYKINREMETSLAYMHAFANQQSGPTYIGNSGSVKMSQDSLGASLSFAF
jgi:long-chain fatty acid transport protein